MGAMSSNESDTTEFDLQRLRRHQPDAVKRWFLQHADAVYTFVYYRANRDADLAADLVQETFLEALARIDDYDPGRGGMLTWLTLLSRNCIHRALRQQDRYRTTERMWEKINARLLTAYRQLESTPLPDEIAAKPILESLPSLGKVLGSKTAREKILEVMADVLEVSLEWGDTPLDLVFTNAVPGLGLYAARAGEETVLEAVAWGGPEAAAVAAKPVEKPATWAT